VLFDGRRIWSFWVLRDSEPRADGSRFVPWPKRLTRFLDGRTQLSIKAHVEDRELYDADAQFGTSEDRVAVVNADGQQLGMDKYGRLQVTFETRTSRDVEPLLDAVAQVLAALREAGVEPFLAYGTLLGAVREGGLIGHDSDADLGYVSRYDHPADVVAESFRLQRHLVARGLSVTRYSGLAFRVNLREGDGVMRGLDVFGGFMRDGHLYLMGEVGTPFREEWVWPLTTVTLEGRRYPAPAAPEHLLAATYGPSWRTPDPAFKFETPRETVRRLDGWFRGTRGGRSLLWGMPAPRRLRVRPVRASATLSWVREAEPEIGTFVDLGCGTGTDAFWMAKRGTPAVGVDFKPSHYRVMEGRAHREELPLTFLWANFNELRSSLVSGAALARCTGPRVAMARHVADALDRAGREQLLRLAETVVRDSGRLYLQVLRGSPGETASRGRGGVDVGGDDGEREDRRRAGLSPVDVDALVAEIEERRGRVLSRQDVVESAADGPHGTDPGEQSREVSRLVVTWRR
jgi:SAM-dependent methyltransferase